MSDSKIRTQPQPEPKRSRPHMRDYGISTSDDGLMTWQWVDEQMAKSRNYWICSTQSDGKPHAAPVWGVWLDGTLYFSTSRTARKAKDLTANPEVVIHLESGDDTVIFEGMVREVTDAAEFARMAQAYVDKYPPIKPEAAPGNVCYALVPRVAFSWLEKDFPKTATRWEF